MPTEILRPNAAGDETNLEVNTGTNVAAVDEASADDDTTYVFSDQNAFIFDSYNLGASALTTETVDAVDVWDRCRSAGDGGGSGEAGDQKQTGVRLSATNVMGTAININGVGYTDREEAALARPGGGAWAVADLANLQVRIGLKQNDAGGGGETRCTQIWVEVNYTAATGVETEVDAVLDEVVASLNAQQRYLSTIGSTVDETRASLNAYLQPGPNIDATLDETLASFNAQQRYLSTITATVDEIAAALNARSFHGTTVGSTLDKVTASFGLSQRYLATIEATVDETQASLNAAQTDLVRIDADLDEVLAALDLLADVSTEIDAVLDKVIAALAAVVPTNITIVSILDEVVAALGVAEVDEGAAIIRWIATRARLQRSEPGRSLTPAGVGIARREPGRGIAPRVSRRIER